MPRSIGVTPTKYKPCSSTSPPHSNDEDSSIFKLDFVKYEEDPPVENEECSEHFNLNITNAELQETSQSDSTGPLSSMIMASGSSPLLNGVRDLAECSETTSKESTPQLMNASPSKALSNNGKSSSANNLLPNGKKTKGRVKIKMEYIGNKLRRYTTFSKRKTGIMKKAHELSTLTGTQVMLLVASETGHVYAFATSKLKPMIASDQGKGLIQACLSTPDENFPDMGAVKTEFTFDAPPLPPQSLNCTPSSLNSRKRKIQGQSLPDGNDLCLPTMVSGGSSLAHCSPFDDNDDEDEECGEDEAEDDEDDEDEAAAENDCDFVARTTSTSACSFTLDGLLGKIQDQHNDDQDDVKESGNKQAKRMKQESDVINSKVGKKQAASFANPHSKQQESELQRTLKEALKAAANQRQRQASKKGPQNHQQNIFSNGMLGNGSSEAAGQQFNPIGILPLMFQATGLSNGASPANSNTSSGSNNNNMAAALNFFLNAASSNMGGNFFGNQEENSSTGNALQQIFSSSFPLGNMNLQQIFAAAALSSALASESSKN